MQDLVDLSSSLAGRICRCGTFVDGERKYSVKSNEAVAVLQMCERKNFEEGC